MGFLYPGFSLFSYKGKNMNKIFKIVFNAARGKMMVVNEATSSVQTGKKAAVTVAVVAALGAGVAQAASYDFTFDSATTQDAVDAKVEASNGIWRGGSIGIVGNAEMTIKSSGTGFSTVEGPEGSVTFVADQGYGLDAAFITSSTYGTVPQVITAKNVKFLNEKEQKYGLYGTTGGNLTVNAEKVNITAPEHAVSLHDGSVVQFNNVAEFTATATTKNALRVVGGSSLTIVAVDGAKIVVKGGAKGDGINVYDNASSLAINNANGTNEISSVLNKGNLTILGETTVNNNFDNQATFTGTSLTVNGGFKNSSSAVVTVDELTLEHPSWANAKDYELEGTINASEKFVYNVGGYEGIKIGAAITTKKLEIQGGSCETGPIITSNDVLANVGEILVQSAGQKTGLIIQEGTAINFDKTVTLAGDGDARVQIQKGGSMSIGNLVSQATKAKVQLDDKSSEVTIKSIDVQEGGLNLEVLANKSTGNARFNIGTIDVAAGTRFNASVYNDNQPNIEVKGIDGALTINLAEGAIVDFGGVKNNDWRSDKIFVNADQITVNVADINNAGSVYLSQEGTNLEKTAVLVTAEGSNNTGDVKANLEKMAGIVALTSNTGATDEAGADAPATMSAATGTRLSIGEGKYNGAATATVGVDNQLTDVVVKENSIVVQSNELASLTTLSLNRVLMNDVRKRMGDLRAAEGTHGVWARYDGGKFSGSMGLENDFTTIQVGIDTVPVADALRFGVAFAYTTSEADMTRGSADMDAFSLAFYGTKMYDNGLFVDVIGRMATADTDVVIDGTDKGSMDNIALSLSGELGWRFDVTDKFYFEPQTELTYTYVTADTLALKSGYEYKYDAVDSLVGRVGFAAGFKCPNNFGDVYVRASAVHEFLGDTKITLGNGEVMPEVDGEDTWVEFGIGANFNVNKNMYIYADIERTEGAKLEEDWRANVGVRYAF